MTFFGFVNVGQHLAVLMRDFFGQFFAADIIDENIFGVIQYNVMRLGRFIFNGEKIFISRHVYTFQGIDGSVKY